MKDKVCCNCLSEVDRVVAPVVCDKCADMLSSAGECPTLRDRFAMAALQGMLANPESDTTVQGFVEDAYRFADAMLKAREEIDG